MVFTRFVEVGRVCFVNFGPEEGKLCVIVDVVDFNSALVDGPTTGVEKQIMPFKRLSLTEYVIPIKRNQKSANVGKVFDAEGIQAKWEESSFGKRRLARLRRATLTDFERFQVMMQKKQMGLKLR
jgi:large subunit ribosomal protein L14e